MRPPPKILVAVTLAVAVAVVLGPAAASAQCRASASGTMSFGVSLSPRSGHGCFHDVVVHRGPSCAGTPEWTVTLGCDETRRMEVTDTGVLINLRAPRPNRRQWEIVRTFTHEVDRIVIVRSIRFDELPGVPAAPAHPRLTLDSVGLRIGEGEDAVLVAIDRLTTLGRRSGRR